MPKIDQNREGPDIKIWSKISRRDCERLALYFGEERGLEIDVDEEVS